MPAQHLEDLLLPVTVLRLSKIIPHWTSKAFHGLVDLCLRVPDGSLIIHESQLALILAHSPRLHALELEINIELANVPVMPAVLHNLGVLITHFSSHSQLGRFLRLLDTGSSPLFVSIDYAYLHSTENLDENVVDFFSRSNVTRLSTEFDEFCMSLQLATLTHTIKRLAINSPGQPWEFYNRTGSTFQVQLEALYLLGGFEFEVDIDQLRDVSDWSGVRKLVIWGRGYQITRGGRPIMNKQSLQKELANIGLAVEIIPSDLPSPVDSFLL